MDGNIILIF